MKRHAHILADSQRTTTPTELICVDTEAQIQSTGPGVERHTLRMGYAIYLNRRRGRNGKKDTRKTLAFTKKEDFWDFVEESLHERNTLYLFAHNWNYDAGILAMSEYIAENAWNVVSYVNEKPPLIIKLRRYQTDREDLPDAPPEYEKPLKVITPRGVKTVTRSVIGQLRHDGDLETYHLRVLDSLNYFGQALSALGLVLGMEKGEIADFRTATDEELAPYNKRDTEILLAMLVRYFEFLEEHDLGNFAPTLAGQSFNAFRHKYMSDEIYIHDNEAICTLEREAYHGGRTECFHIGKVEGPLYYLDVNSLYPSVMLEGVYPTCYIDAGEGMTLEALADYLKKGFGVIADCSIETDEPAYAKVEDGGGRLIFPVGTFWSALSSPELAYALEQGHIKDIGRWALYDQAPIYKAYVKDFYDMRLRFKESGEQVYAYIVKGLLNSLYGKSGQKGIVYENTGEAKEQDDGLWIDIDANGKRHQKRIRLGQVQELVEEVETRESFPAIAAHVTAQARMKMWRLIRKAGPLNVFYMDTDSLIVNEEGFWNLAEDIDENRLGKLKLEEEAQTALFRGPKDYTFGEKTEHIKGISKRARKIQHDLYEQDRFVSWDRIASRGEDGYIEVRREQKRLVRHYRKGVVMPGGRVDPIKYFRDFSLGYRSLNTIEEIDAERREVKRRPPSDERDDYLDGLSVLRESVLESCLSPQRWERWKELQMEEQAILMERDSLKLDQQAMERPSWSSGLSYATLREIAKHEGRNPYEPDWGDSIDMEVVRSFRALAQPPLTLATFSKRLREVRAEIAQIEASARESFSMEDVSCPQSA